MSQEAKRALDSGARNGSTFFLAELAQARWFTIGDCEALRLPVADDRRDAHARRAPGHLSTLEEVAP
jgi:hypothetical protein